MSVMIVDCSLLHFNMAPVNSSISNNVSLSPVAALITRKSNFLSSCTIPRKLNAQTFPYQKHSLPLSTSIRLFPQFGTTCVLKPKLVTRTLVSTSGIDVDVEEADLSPADNQTSVTATDATDISGESSIKSEISPVKSKPSRIKKSLMPPVKIEELIPGATFKGKVVSVQPFGAFVDFGAFTDGLVHVSRLCHGFVKDVGHVVTVGQEVTIGIIEANMETGRISLSMRENDDPAKAVQQQRDGSVSSDTSIPPRVKRSVMPPVEIEELIPGATFKGKVVSIHPFGAFVDIGAFTDGLVHVSCLADGFVKDVGDFVTVGQEVTVRLTEANMETRRISLSMRESDDPAKAAQQQNFVKGIEVDVEEADLSPADNQTSVTVTDATDISGESSIKSEISPVKSKHSRIKKSSMPPVKIEELIPGATFKGKVVSTHPFGAFVDFGAFTDGLVHVSNLYDGFVKDVGDFVTVGQEVTVRLTEANMETRRISLSMRESDDPAKAAQQQRDGPFSTDKSGPPRKYNQRNFVKGQNLEGTVKNLTRSGAFISLPEGEEGFLPSSEEPVEGFANMMGGTSLEVGQKVSVRVLRITRGKVTLTMKKEEDLSELDAKLNQGVVHKATNPFALAFQRNSVMSAFLDKRKKENEATLYAVGSGMDDVTSLDALDREENAENNEEAELSGKVSDLSSEIVEKAEEDAVEDAILNDEEQTKEPRNGVPSDVQSASELFGNPPSLIDATETDGEPLVSGELTDQTSSHTVGDAILNDEEQTTEPRNGVPSDVQSASELFGNRPSLIDTTETDGEPLVSGELTDQTSSHNVGDAILNDEEQTTEPRNGVPSDVQSASELFGNPLSLIDATETDGEPLVSGELTDQTSSHTVEQVTTEASDNVIGKDDEA